MMEYGSHVWKALVEGVESACSLLAKGSNPNSGQMVRCPPSCSNNSTACYTVGRTSGGFGFALLLSLSMSFGIPLPEFKNKERMWNTFITKDMEYWLFCKIAHFVSIREVFS